MARIKELEISLKKNQASQSLLEKEYNKLFLENDGLKLKLSERTKEIDVVIQ